MLKFPLLLCLVLSSVITRGAGIRELLIPPGATGPEILARLWTPCAVAPRVITVGRGPSIPLTIKAVKDCPSLGKDLPLIVVSHGLFGDVFDHHDTAEFLADAGFAVVTLDHTLDSSSTIKDKSQDDIASFLVRTEDISRVLDFLLNTSQSIVNIDPQRIGFFGWSRGGYTGLVLAGAVPNFQYPLPIPCPEELLMCRQIRDGNIPKHAPGYEPRIKAFVIADPVSFFRIRPVCEKLPPQFNCGALNAAAWESGPMTWHWWRNIYPMTPNIIVQPILDTFLFSFPAQVKLRRRTHSNAQTHQASTASNSTESLTRRCWNFSEKA